MFLHLGNEWLHPPWYGHAFTLSSRPPPKTREIFVAWSYCFEGGGFPIAVRFSSQDV